MMCKPNNTPPKQKQKQRERERERDRECANIFVLSMPLFTGDGIQQNKGNFDLHETGTRPYNQKASSVDI